MSRRLFFVFLAANLILWLWESYGRRPAQRKVLGTVETPMERLVLLGELPQLPHRPAPAGVAGVVTVTSQEAENVSVPVSSTSPPSAMAVDESVPSEERRSVEQCHLVGPFPERASAEAFAAQLRRLHIGVEIRLVEETVVRGYWLRYPPVADLATARENLERLRSQGLRDLWLFTHGPWRGAISLGMYSERGRAERMAERLRRQGIPVRVMPKKERIPRYWVQLNRQPFPGWLKSLGPSLKGRNCDHSGESAIPIRVAGAGFFP